MSTRRRARALLVVATLVFAIGLVVPSASATSALRRTFHATLGAGAHYGSVTILAYMAGDALSQTTLQHLKPDATYSVRIYAGACNRLGPLARTLPSMRTDASGSATRTLAISAGKMNNVWGYVRSQPVVIRFVSGSSVVCGRLSFPVVTRVVISAYKIDLAVVEPPGSTARFPYCNVAEYFEALSQPGEPGVTLLFAHARTGMFLPLLTKSKVANGAAMVGKMVRVYMSTNQLYTYEITKVRRHQSSIQSAVTTTAPQLWLQTSEGPNSSSKKLIIVARLVSTTAASAAASHPTPHRVVCH